MTTDLTTRVTELAGQIEARLADDEAAAQAAASVAGPDWQHDLFIEANRGATTMITSAAGSPLADTLHRDDEEMAPFIARNDPIRVLRRVAATRSLVAAIQALPHVLDDSEYYGCRAITHNYFDAHGNPFPESDGRYVPTGRDCTCGRDEDVARLLGIIASEYDDDV